jgi:hypothetical protein
MAANLAKWRAGASQTFSWGHSRFMIAIMHRLIESDVYLLLMFRTTKDKNATSAPPLGACKKIGAV